MASLSDMIEDSILQMFENQTFAEIQPSDKNQSIELKRNRLAQKFECAPSQINYVLTTRFKNDRGYYIESRRGGGGYIKITRLISEKLDGKQYILDNIGYELTYTSAYNLIDYLNEQSFLTDRESRISKSVISNRALENIPADKRNEARADILKEIILVID